jgi:hypothetical protein
MIEMNDDELQQWLDNKQPLPKSDELSNDAKAYSTLFEALGDEPANGLPYDFTAKVTRHIAADIKRGNELRSNLLVAAIFVAVVAIICGIIAIVNPATTSTLLQYKWILLLLPIVFMAIQYFDQKLVKTRIFSCRSYKP